MHKLLIIYPHWIPSNLVGVQRARLIANFLHLHGWEPIIVAVDPEYYEEPLVEELRRTVRPGIKTYFCSARKARPGRIIGDIALRAFGSLTRKAVEVARIEKPDFIWTPLPSFYTALIARRVSRKTDIPYGLDYMDPWVHDFPGARFPNKAWLAKRVAQLLEPIAVRHASLLTGVTGKSYLPVISRNPRLRGICHGEMPLGFDPADFSLTPDNTRLLWADEPADTLPIIYAGAFLPQAHFYVDTLFSILAEMRRDGELDPRVRFYFVGTGRGRLRSIASYAEEHGIADIVSEQPDRISYLEVIHNLRNAFGVLAIGNREPHYTASKIFQTILSGRRVFPVFHHLSTVCNFLEAANADNFLVSYSPQTEVYFRDKMKHQLVRFLSPSEQWNPDLSALNQYSADAVASCLADLLNEALDRQ